MVVHFLPRLIGKEFFKKTKLPLGVDFRKKNLKLQVERALGSALLYLSTGTCCTMKVGKVAMEEDEIVENVFDAIKGAVEKVPKKWDGVRSLHLKFYDSVALPVYQALPDVKLKIEGFKEREERAEIAKISDSEGEVKETSGKGGKRKKGRIHEVRYMDVGEDVENDDDDDLDGSEQVRSKDNDEFAGQKGVEESDDDEDDDMDESKKIEEEDLSLDETVVKKRNKGKASKEGALGVSNGEKRAKKKAKSDKNESGKPKNDILSSGEVKAKKKSELGKKPIGKIVKGKDMKHKKRVAAK